MKSKLYTADFETTTDLNDCRVWAFGICDINNTDKFIHGNNIDDFFKILQESDTNDIYYFHNLKFDGEFIFYFLLKNGYRCIKDKKEKDSKTFTCLISSLGQFYSIEIYFKVKGKRVKKVTIYDSMKILNFSVSDIAKGFNLECKKGEIDYKAYRPIGHQLTNDEIDYLKHDVTIVALALNQMFKKDLTKMTIGSDALHSYKSINKNFKKYFPVLDYKTDSYIRKSYKGGFTYLNPIYKDKIIHNGVVLDVNSLYPSVMYDKSLPYGEPIFFENQYMEDKLYPLYIQNITCSFKLKKNKIPTIQIKNNISFIPNEYLSSSDGEIIFLSLTNVDLNLFFENYDVFDLEYHGGFKFKAIKGLFCSYIDIWSNEKIKAKENKNAALYLISKLMLNSLYGKFGLNPEVQGKYPVLNEEDIVTYKLYEKEIRDSIYLPVATFITSYAREITIRTSQKIREYSLQKYDKDLYVYSDTDSIHCLIENPDELKDIINIDEYKLGFWKHETSFIKAKFIRQKCYIEEDENGLNVTIAGMPKFLGKYINFDNFHQGFTTDNLTIDKSKLRYKHTKGGVVLVDTPFTIK